MIFFLLRFNSFLRLLFGATLLVSCLEKTPPEAIPATQDDDKIVGLLQTEIVLLEADRKVMQERIAQVEKSLEENALRPMVQEYSRKEFFQYDKMMRQIDQQIDYFKIKKALREKNVYERVKKGLNLKDLEVELAAFELDKKATAKTYAWRKLPKLEKPKEQKKQEGHEEKEDPHAPAPKEDSKGGHH